MDIQNHDMKDVKHPQKRCNMCTIIDMCQFCSNSLELILARNTIDVSHLLLIRLTPQVRLSKGI